MFSLLAAGRPSHPPAGHGGHGGVGCRAVPADRAAAASPTHCRLLFSFFRRPHVPVGRGRVAARLSAYFSTPPDAARCRRAEWGAPRRPWCPSLSNFPMLSVVLGDRVRARQGRVARTGYSRAPRGGSISIRAVGTDDGGGTGDDDDGRAYGEVRGGRERMGGGEDGRHESSTDLRAQKTVPVEQACGHGNRSSDGRRDTPQPRHSVNAIYLGSRAQQPPTDMKRKHKTASARTTRDTKQTMYMVSWPSIQRGFRQGAKTKPPSHAHPQTTRLARGEGSAS